MSVVLAAAQQAVSTTPEVAGVTHVTIPWVGPVIGASLGFLIAQVVRWLDLGSEVRRNDAVIEEHDTALVDWTADREMRLRVDSELSHRLGRGARHSLNENR
jgi:hypothetical protein